MLLLAPVYAFFVAVGALVGEVLFGYRPFVQPNYFIGSIALVPLVLLGLPLHSLWQYGARTIPTLTALYVGHVTYGLTVCLLLGLWVHPHYPFQQCVGIFPSLSFSLLVTAWIGSSGLRTDPGMPAGRLAFLALRSLAASGFAGLVIGPSIIFIVMEALNAWAGTPSNSVH